MMSMNMTLTVNFLRQITSCAVDGHWSCPHLTYTVPPPLSPVEPFCPKDPLGQVNPADPLLPFSPLAPVGPF